MRLPRYWTNWTKIFSWLGDFFSFLDSLLPPSCFVHGGFKGLLLYRSLGPFVAMATALETFVAVTFVCSDDAPSKLRFIFRYFASRGERIMKKRACAARSG